MEIPDSTAEGGVRIIVPTNRRGGTFLGAFFNFCKSMIGTGVLGLPHIFLYSGLYGGVLLFFITALISTFAQIVTLQVKRKAESRAPHPAYIETFPDVAEFILGVKGRRVVQLFMILLQLSFCSGYIIVISDQVHSMYPKLSVVEVTFILVPIFAFLCSIKLMRKMWISSLIGVMVYMIGIVGVILWYGLENFHPVNYKNFTFQNSWLFFGTAIYAMEGNLAVIPVETSMKHPEYFMAVMLLAMSSTYVIFATMSSVAYMLGYTCDLVTDCLPNQTLRMSVQIALIVALIFTYPLQMFIGTEIVEQLMLPDRVAVNLFAVHQSWKKKRSEESMGLLSRPSESVDGPDGSTTHSDDQERRRHHHHHRRRRSNGSSEPGSNFAPLLSEQSPLNVPVPPADQGLPPPIRLDESGVVDGLIGTNANTNTGTGNNGTGKDQRKRKSRNDRRRNRKDAAAADDDECVRESLLDARSFDDEDEIGGTIASGEQSVSVSESGISPVEKLGESNSERLMVVATAADSTNPSSSSSSTSVIAGTSNGDFQAPSHSRTVSVTKYGTIDVESLAALNRASGGGARPRDATSSESESAVTKKRPTSDEVDNGSKSKRKSKSENKSENKSESESGSETGSVRINRKSIDEDRRSVASRVSRASRAGSLSASIYDEESGEDDDEDENENGEGSEEGQSRRISIVREYDVERPRVIKYREAKRLLLRFLEVVLTAVVAVAVPNFQVFTSFVGGVLLSIIGFIVPVVLYWLIWDPAEYTWYNRALHVFMVFCGFAFMGMGIASSVYSLQHPSPSSNYTYPELM